jgi:hypothetical protein
VDSSFARLESTCQLHRISALLKASDHAVLQRPTCANRALKVLPVALARPEYANRDDPVACFKKFRRLGVPILKIRKQAREEIADAGETEINIAVRKAWNNFPTHVRREHLADDFGVSARFIKPTDNSAIFLR